MLVLEIALGIVLGVVLLSILPLLFNFILDGIEAGMEAIGKGFVPMVKKIVVAICGVIFFLGSGVAALYFFTEKLELLPWWMSWIVGLFIVPTLAFYLGDLIYKKINRN